MLFSLVFALSLKAHLEGDTLVLTITNDTTSPQLVTGLPDADVVVQKKGDALVFERVLEIEDLGPIARAPAPPRWTKPQGEPMRGAYVIAPKATATIRVSASTAKLGDTITLKTLKSATPWLIAEHSVQKVEREQKAQREFGKWVPTVRATVRYTQRAPSQTLGERPPWDLSELVTDAPALSFAWPALVAEKDVGSAKTITAKVEAAEKPLVSPVMVKAKLDGATLVLTVTNPTATPQLVVNLDNEAMTLEKRGVLLYFERALEIEDLGPIARAPLPPRWTKPKGDVTLRGAYYVAANSSASIRIEGATARVGETVTLTVVPSDAPAFVLSEQGTKGPQKLDPQRQFGKWVSQATVTARYAPLTLRESRAERGQWKLEPFASPDTPPLSQPWPALVSDDEIKQAGKQIAVTVQ